MSKKILVHAETANRETVEALANDLAKLCFEDKGVQKVIIRVEKPGAVRWDYDKPEKRSLFVQGKTLWIWRPDDKEAQVKRDFGGDELSSAFTFLWGKGDLLKEFAPKALPAQEGLPAGDALELRPLKPGGSITRACQSDNPNAVKAAAMPSRKYRTNTAQLDGPATNERPSIRPQKTIRSTIGQDSSAG